MKRTAKITPYDKKFKKDDGTYGTVRVNYSKVKDRLIMFREDCPRGVITTTPIIEGEQIIFKCFIKKDNSDENSAESTGHAYSGEVSGTKSFEKTETLAVGRALALLGYAGDGEIASYEEMEEYNKWQDNLIESEIAKIQTCKTIDELRSTWLTLKHQSRSEVIKAKDEKKLLLNK